MNKKLKIAYFAMMAICGIICIADIVIAKWMAAVFMGTTVLWLFNTYRLVSTNCDCIAELNRLSKELSESHKREHSDKQEFNKMRQRAEDAERKLKELQDNTPARGKDGRYIKREH